MSVEPEGPHSSGSDASGLRQKLGRRVDDSLVGMVRWAQGRSGRSSPGLDVLAQHEGSAAQWSGLVSAVQTYAVAAAGVGDAVGLLRSLYGVESAQGAMLAAIRRDVRLLREGPFRTGRFRLHEAMRVGEEDSRYTQFLGDAERYFSEAWGNAASVQERALVEFHLGCAWLLLGNRQDAEHWLEQSYQAGRLVVAELAARSESIRVLHSPWTTAAATYFYPVGIFVLPVKLKRVWGAQRAIATLGAFVPFVNCVAASYNALSGPTRLPELSFAASEDGSYALSEIAATPGELSAGE